MGSRIAARLVLVRLSHDSIAFGHSVAISIATPNIVQRSINASVAFGRRIEPSRSGTTGSDQRPGKRAAQAGPDKGRKRVGSHHGQQDIAAIPEIKKIQFSYGRISVLARNGMALIPGAIAATDSASSTIPSPARALRSINKSKRLCGGIAWLSRLQSSAARACDPGRFT
jgi:hypothetical protein